MSHRARNAHKARLHVTRLRFGTVVGRAYGVVRVLFGRSGRFRPGSGFSSGAIYVSRLFSFRVVTNFPGLCNIPMRAVPVFLSSVISRGVAPPCLSVARDCNIPTSIYPLPSTRTNITVGSSCPVFNGYFLSYGVPYSNSAVGSSCVSEHFGLPSRIIGIPLECARRRMRGCTISRIGSYVEFVRRRANRGFS